MDKWHETQKELIDLDGNKQNRTIQQMLYFPIENESAAYFRAINSDSSC